MTNGARHPHRSASDCGLRPSTDQRTTAISGYVHGIAFVVISFALIPMYLFMWRRLRRSPGWESFGRYTLAMGVLTVPLEIGSIALQEIVPFSWFYLWLGAQLLSCLLLGLRLWHTASQANQVELPAAGL